MYEPKIGPPPEALSRPLQGFYTPSGVGIFPGCPGSHRRPRGCPLAGSKKDSWEQDVGGQVISTRKAPYPLHREQAEGLVHAWSVRRE